ncbi:response regulator [Nostoc sp. 'Lobaria pulmonaria (5183) cyanobiont']|uniref:response regulator n=1 Tax=Nostoc sp. 'Lobaria pulmonaria (5183) cyanobiont' TaxID=1618022 RepID=UPI000D0C5F28|nr:response regulator [Nostoc sp. 'Lobaria pulmonaria (5183) cyanobiont']AVH69629.1 response regulator receiver protein/heterocyst pattern formation protein PatA [Nostoc sp. 'Lobaria pulmonaria (5183) cyanobiont']
MNQLIEQLQTKLFTGRLNLEARDGPTWTLYFRLGRLIWQAGGSNADERWRRHLSQYCSNLDVTQLQWLVPPQENYREYCILAKLREQKLIEQQQLVSLIISLIAEVLFDIMQYVEAKRNGENPAGQLSHTTVVGEVPGFLLTVIPTEEVLKQATQAWQEWRGAGLASYSPNLFPVIQQLELLQGHASSKQIISLVDGTKTLRGLGQKSGRDALVLARLLMPLVKAGAIAFSPIPNFKKVGISKETGNSSNTVNNSNSSPKTEEDTVIQVGPNFKKVAPPSTNKETGNLSNTVNNSNSSLKTEENTVIQVALPAASKQIVSPSSAVNNSNSSLKTEENTVIQVAPPAASKAIIDVSRPLVACVDDSPTICRSLEEILTHQGYRFVGVQESLTAVLKLIKSKPDFIFLDLLMPKVNGYEICSQIRKTPSLKDVPVVILTGKDGIVDRMRAKLVGATDFLGKPVEAEKVLNVLHKYLSV